MNDLSLCNKSEHATSFNPSKLLSKTQVRCQSLDSNSLREKTESQRLRTASPDQLSPTAPNAISHFSQPKFAGKTNLIKVPNDA
jgi:hypothetical protein